jgi:hypothetical protein
VKEGGLGKTESCDPLAPNPDRIELGRVLAVGRDADGTVYVVDRADDSKLRAFVAEGTVLVRKDVIGTGEGNEPGFERLSLLIEASPRYRLLVELAAGAAVRMARAEGEEERELDIDLLEGGELLEMLDADTVDGYAIRNLPGEIRVEYLARTPEDELLVVLVPEDDFAYEKFRLFFDKDGKLVERELDEVIRRRDGGTTNLLFTLDGRPADALFPIENDGRTFTRGQARLEVGGETVDLDWLDPDIDAALLDEAAFACLVED